MKEEIFYWCLNLPAFYLDGMIIELIYHWKWLINFFLFFYFFSIFEKHINNRTIFLHHLHYNTFSKLSRYCSLFSANIHWEVHFPSIISLIIFIPCLKFSMNSLFSMFNFFLFNLCFIIKSIFKDFLFFSINKAFEFFLYFYHLLEKSMFLEFLIMIHQNLMNHYEYIYHTL